MVESLRPIGFVNFDDIRGQNNEIELRVPYDDINRLQRGQYVLVGNGNTPYLGRIVSGPFYTCLLYTSPSPRDRTRSRMPSSA